MGPLIYNAVYPKMKEGAPLKAVDPPEGVPRQSLRDEIPKTAVHVNAARPSLNWCLSKEGQIFMIDERGNLTSLKVEPMKSRRFDPKVFKVWYPNFDQLHETACRLGRGMGQDLRLSAVSVAFMKPITS